MYIMNSMIVRRSKVRLVEAVRKAPNADVALGLIHDEVEPELQELLDPKEAEAFSRSVREHIAGATSRRILTKDDFYGALASFGWFSSHASRPRCRFSFFPSQL